MVFLRDTIVRGFKSQLLASERYVLPSRGMIRQGYLLARGLSLGLPRGLRCMPSPPVRRSSTPPFARCAWREGSGGLEGHHISTSLSGIHFGKHYPRFRRAKILDGE